MSALVLLLSLAVAVFLAFPLQMWIPPLAWLHGARVFLVPMLFCYGALALPYPAMLALAVWAGLLTDLACLHVVGAQVEIAVGASIVYFVIVGSVAHGMQPAWRQGAWWLHPVFSAVATSLLLALQFALLSLRREGFFFGEAAAWRILGPGLVAALCAPVVHLATWRAGLLPRRKRPHLAGP